MMSERCVLGTRPLMLSDRCTTIPWASRTDTVPLDRKTHCETCDKTRNREEWDRKTESLDRYYVDKCPIKEKAYSVRLSYLYDLTSLKVMVSEDRLVNHTPGSKFRCQCIKLRQSSLAYTFNKSINERTYLRRVTKWMLSMRLKSRIRQVCSGLASNLFSFSCCCLGSLRWFFY